jgi:kynurenine formamidase
MPTYPGLEPARFGAVVDHDSSAERYAGRAEFFLGKIDTPTNLGTYIDSPFHRYRNGRDLGDLDLEELCGLPAIVMDHDPHSGRVVDITTGVGELRGKALLVRSGWSARWGRDEYWDLGPYLSDASVTLLIESGVRMVGVDFWNVDDTTDPARPAHTRLLDAGILIVEHLRNLEALPRDGFRFFAPVLAIGGGASFPVRAFAELPD